MLLKTYFRFEFIVESLKCLADEFGSIIVDDSSRYTKAVYYVMLDDFDHVGCLYFLQGDGFRPFGEVISYCQD